MNAAVRRRKGITLDEECRKEINETADEGVEQPIHGSRARGRVHLGFMFGLLIFSVVCMVVLPVSLRKNSDDKQQKAQVNSTSYYSDQGVCWNNEQGQYPEEESIGFTFLGTSQNMYLNTDMSKTDDFSGHQRAFDVFPNHTILEGQSGIIFNVETVTEPLMAYLHEPTLTKDEILDQVREEAAVFYEVVPSDIIVESSSKFHLKNDEINLIFAGGQSFLAACLMAFAHHLPLRLSPDGLWAVISHGFMRHVDRHPEELRHHFVAHKGKKRINVTEPRLILHETQPEQWEEWIFPSFSVQIAENMNNKEAYETLTGSFSTTTPTTKAAVQVVLMATMKNYFKYGIPGCGIPSIQLDGTRNDWVFLRDRAKKLAQWMMPHDTHGDLWIYDIILPILDEFVSAYDGNINYCFWQNMIKFRSKMVPGLCVQRREPATFLSGWIATLYPYLSPEGGEEQPNPFLKPWSLSARPDTEGPDPSDIPTLISTAPVEWYAYGKHISFHAGFRGVHQDEADGTLRPVLGWYITHDPELTSKTAGSLWAFLKDISRVLE